MSKKKAKLSTLFTALIQITLFSFLQNTASSCLNIRKIKNILKLVCFNINGGKSNILRNYYNTVTYNHGAQINKARICEVSRLCSVNQHRRLPPTITTVIIFIFIIRFRISVLKKRILMSYPNCTHVC